LPEGAELQPLPPDWWRQVFSNDRPVAVEIGPGRGEFLLASARADPQRNFFAIEHSASRTREITAGLAQSGVENARVICGDAVCLIELLPAASVEAFYVLFPDPWWKRRHKKRLLWTPRFAAGVRRALTRGGTVELITDVADYFELAQRCLDGAGLAVVTIDHAATAHTSFARKAQARGVALHRSVHTRP
jgi:tRNA (guanine-N7-)-methyltransferase